MAKRAKIGNLTRLEKEALKRLDKLLEAQRALRDIEDQIASVSHDRLVQIGQESDPEKFYAQIDEEIKDELEQLQRKRDKVKRGETPTYSAGIREVQYLPLVWPTS